MYSPFKATSRLQFKSEATTPGNPYAISARTALCHYPKIQYGVYDMAVP